MSENKPKIVAITGAAGNIGYTLCAMVASGQLLGEKHRVFMNLIEIPPVLKVLAGIADELRDCASPQFAGVKCTSDLKEGFKDADIIILVGGKPRKDGQERADLLMDNGNLFVEQGKAINEVANPDAKIVVVANPANCNALILSKHCPKIPRKNISALTRLDHNRAISAVTGALDEDDGLISNPIIWGNHSGKMCVDITNIKIDGKKTVIEDKFQKPIQGMVSRRGGEIIKQTGKSSGLSAAKATCDHIRDWVLGTKEGEFVSMAVLLDEKDPLVKEYGLPTDKCFSVPVTCKEGEWKVVEGLKLNDFVKEGIQTNIEDLQSESDCVKDLLK